MKTNIISALHVCAIFLWLAVSLVFAVIGCIPASVVTRPIRRWAFCVQRACEVRAKRNYLMTTYCFKFPMK